MKIVHENSIESYRQFGVKERRELVLSVYQREPHECFTDRQVAVRLGFLDMNSVRPRISELIDSGILIEEMAKVRCFITKKLVRLVRLNASKGKDGHERNISQGSNSTDA